MTNDTDNTQQADAPQELPSFEQTPWHGMIGVRTDDKGNADVRAVCSPIAAVERAAGGVHFDRTMPAVYFIDWFNRNREALWKMAMHEHALYCNLKRATDGIGKSSGLRLVDTEGQRIQ